jgi:5'-methylthioadenosine/S-adenosylhomocysteine nucleosidase
VVAILAALDGEIREILKALGDRRETAWKDFIFHCGRLDGHEVVLARCGVGKSMSAMLAQRLIDQFEPAALICTGLAGGLGATVRIGDTLVARDCLQHDLDASVFGFKRGEIPYSGRRIFACDPGLLEAAMSYLPAHGRLVAGRILTGDQFITRREFECHRYLVDELNGDAVEMEGASIALVADVNDLPFLLVRTISDKADEAACLDIKAFLPMASRNSLACVRHVLARSRP